MAGALELVSTTVRALQHCRDISQETFHEVMESIETKYGEMQVPRKCNKQINRSNVECENAEAFYRRSIFVPLLDGVLVSLEKRFNNQTQQAMKLSFLLPINISTSATANTFYGQVKEAYAFWSPIFLMPKSEQQVLGEWDIWVNL